MAMGDPAEPRAVILAVSAALMYILGWYAVVTTEAVQLQALMGSRRGSLGVMAILGGQALVHALHKWELREAREGADSGD